MHALSPQHRGACLPTHHSKPLAHVPHVLLRPLPQQVAAAANLANARASAMSRTATVARGLARQILAQPGIEGDPLAFLDVSEAYWRALRNQKHEPQKKGPTVVTYADGPLPPPSLAAPTIAPAGGASAALYDYDVVICGGTLGLFLATALQLRGWRIAIVEKRLVQGRNQEWNISWGELEVLVELGLLSREELRAAVVSEFNPIRVGFMGGEDLWTSDVLNLGVQPKKLLDSLKRRFAAAGGVIYENTAFRAAAVHTDGLRLTLTPGGSASPLAVGDTNRPNGLGVGSSSAPVAPRALNCRLLLDCMGHYSDIVRQIRGRVKPDGMCMVVGSCAEGFPAESNVSADLLYSLSHSRQDMQLFWEAFPAEGGKARTTYMFAYSDAHPDRPTFENLLDTYFEMLPEYQGLPLEQLHFKRVLFGGFPCYSNGPLPPAFDRIMQIGDASAAQSPLSFGGFGSMMRHLSRLTRGINQALAEDRLHRADLGWLQPYQPSLAASWLFQRSMSFGVGQAAYPADYPHAPPYAATTAAAAESDASSSLDAAPMLLGAGAGPAAAFQEAVAMAAARFASGAADPADYFHQDEEEQQERAAAGIAAPVVQQQPKQQRGNLFERDFRDTPAWQRLPYNHVNEILGCNFGVMGILGDRVLRPFLQDTIQVIPLSLSMAGMMLANPGTVSRVLLQVGPSILGSWFLHYAALLAYSVGYLLLRPLRQVVPYYGFQRLLDALEYGSGSDYHYHGPSATPPAPHKAVGQSKEKGRLQVTASSGSASAAIGGGEAAAAPAALLEGSTVPAGAKAAVAGLAAAAGPLADALGPNRMG